MKKLLEINYRNHKYFDEVSFKENLKTAFNNKLLRY